MGLRNVYVRYDDDGRWKRPEPVDYVLADAPAVAVFVLWRRRRCAGRRGSS